ncbi:MAG: alpha-amylase family glycosyl hydrolase [Prochloraceae cyanobacterium]|nr:alpha-amylase family glycosyl hydrolase [Prochloraceae cyanobacterium]
MKYDVMLQGFHWKSHEVRNLGRSWYSIIEENARRIKNSGFSLVWFPPPSDSVNPQGYEPRQLNKLDSAYGSESELINAVNALQPEVKTIADIVINHRSGTSNNEDFTNPDWPRETIVFDDEDGGHDNSINWDTGHRADFSRDLDHKNPTTQDGVSKWMNLLKSKVNFAGWRYDLVKGYAGWAIELYNKKTNPVFSVGEFFDNQVQPVIDWIDSTHRDPAFRSTAFDFPLRNTLHQAIAWKNFHWLKYADRAPGLMGQWSDKAITFLENHDTEEARGGQFQSFGCTTVWWIKSSMIGSKSILASTYQSMLRTRLSTAT